MNEFADIDRELADAFAQRPSTLSRPSLRDVKNRARRRQRQRSASLLGACAVVGVGGAAVLATRSPANQTAVGDGTGSTICFPNGNPVEFGDSIPPTYSPTTYAYSGDVFHYTVQPGDNPTAVANSFGVTLQEMDAANVNTPDYGLFQVGLQLAIPLGHGVEPTVPPQIAGTYILQAGDYPGLLAEQFRVTVAELDAVNRDVPGYGGFIVGTVINVPYPSQVFVATTTTNVTATGVPQTTLLPEPTAWTTTTISIDGEDYVTVYHVQQGDTPEAVANAFDVTLAGLDAANVETPGYAEWLVGTAVRIPFQSAGATTTTEFTGSAVPNSVIYADCSPVSSSTTPEATVSTIVGDTSSTTTTTIPNFTKIGTAVQVINCSGQDGTAGYLTIHLAEEGFTMASAEYGTIDLPVTAVLYNPDDPYAYAVALTLAVYLGVLPVAPGEGSVPSLTGTWFPGSGVIVCLGDDLAGMTLAQIAGVINGLTAGPTNPATTTIA